MLRNSLSVDGKNAYLSISNPLICILGTAIKYIGFLMGWRKPKMIDHW